MNKWHNIPGGMRRRGSTCDDGRLCMLIGETAPHSHYAWALNELWAAYGDVMSLTPRVS